MKTILHISVLELENLLCKKLVWLTAAGYVLAALTICLCDSLRQSYFYDVESLPIELTNFVEPYFLATALISALAPVFAGDREQNLDQLSAACLAGRKGRTAAKILASCVFAVTICGLFGAISVLIPAACGTEACLWNPSAGSWDSPAGGRFPGIFCSPLPPGLPDV